jgi:hypothetical protein
VAVGTGGQNVGNACPGISAIHWANAPPARRLGTGEILAVFSIHCCIQSTEKTDEERCFENFFFYFIFQKIFQKYIFARSTSKKMFTYLAFVVFTLSVVGCWFYLAADPNATIDLCVGCKCFHTDKALQMIQLKKGEFVLFSIIFLPIISLSFVLKYK